MIIFSNPTLLPPNTVSSLGLVAVILLVWLLIQRELLRVLAVDHLESWLRATDIAIVPLVIAFGVVVIRHVINILYPL